MAERSTAAVDVADTSGEEPLTAKAGKATDDGAKAEKVSGGEKDAAGTDEERAAAIEAQPPELHSGHKLARRYRLEECVTGRAAVSAGLTGRACPVVVRLL